MVQTLTGDGFGSGTDARVHINLIGTLGDTGKRLLVHNLETTQDKFESGQVRKYVLTQFLDLSGQIIMKRRKESLLEIIQLAYRRSMVLLRCLLVPV